mgnify:CR=1 FL=1
MAKNNSRTPRPGDFKSQPDNPKYAVFGEGVIPYCDNERCWLLPDGPEQKNRRIRDFSKAMEFAKAMNNLLSHKGA